MKAAFSFPRSSQTTPRFFRPSRTRCMALLKALLLTITMNAQVPLYDSEPALEWKQITWAPNDWDGSPQPNQEDSGDEWWRG